MKTKIGKYEGCEGLIDQNQDGRFQGKAKSGSILNQEKMIGF